MSTLHFREDDRLFDLLADRALDALTPEEEQELRELSGRLFDPASTLDHAAASLELATLRPDQIQPMPAGLQQRLLESGMRWCEEAPRQRPMQTPVPRLAPVVQVQSDVVATLGTGTRQASSRRGASWAWLATAAALTLAAVGWLRPSGSSVGSVPGSGAVLTAVADTQALERSVLSASDVVRMEWKDWDNPELPGVRGEVFWSDSLQRGVMRFKNLPQLDSDREQYQLWIVDSRGLADDSGQSMRISGGVFNGGSREMQDGKAAPDVVVPITPGIKVQGAQAFAITIEKPQGTWVSDMQRRVVIASR